MKWLLGLLIVVVVLLHQDTWLWTDKTLVFGFLPSGLVYHFGYCLLASALMWLLVRCAWPRELEAAEPARETGELRA